MKIPDPSKICFGLTEEIDKESFAIFLQLAGKREFAHILAQRCSTEEILKTVDQIMALLKTHLSEQEYHELFLGENHPH